MKSGWRRVAAVAGLALVTVASPAAARDLAELTCVQNSLGQTLREAVDVAVYKSLNSANHTMAYPLDLRAKMEPALSACAAQFSWSESATQSAAGYWVATLGLPAARRVIAEHDINPNPLEDCYLALPLARRERANIRDIMTLCVDPDIFPKPDPGVDEYQAGRRWGLLIGALFANLMLADQYRAKFRES